MRAFAGKYAPLIGAAGAGLIGAGGSIIGNLKDQEQGEGPARIATEALMAGANAAPAGLALGMIPKLQKGARTIVDRMPNVTDQSRQKAMASANKGFAAGAGINLALVPAYAGLGGLIGGGVSNVANAIGIPGFQPGVVVNPEELGSSNTPGALRGTSTSRYIS